MSKRASINLLSRLQAALPVLAVAALAAYTWWLVQSAPGAVHDAGAKPSDSLPDYVMERATVERFDAKGQLISVLQGDSISHYLSGDRVVVRGLHLSAVDPKGQQLVAQASEGHYLGDSSVVDLLGHAHVTVSGMASRHAHGPVAFDGDALSVNTETRQLRSDKPARVSSAQGEIRGGSLRYDAKVGISEVGGRVNGRLVPVVDVAAP
jgi:lipopolysaccharide export system protein LptC